METINEILTPSGIVGIIIAICEVIKNLGFPKKYIPIVDLVLGLAMGICVYGLYLHHGMVEAALYGVALGLSACGLFSGVKNTIKGE